MTNIGMATSIATTRLISARRPLAAPALSAASTPAAPLFDFPDVSAGRTMKIAPGSKVGLLSPTGTAQVQRLDADGTTIRIDAVAAGTRASVELSVKRSGDGRVLITVKNLKTGTLRTAVGTVVKSTPNFSQFVASGSADTTTIRQSGAQIVVDTKIPTLGMAHIVLQ